MPEGMSRPRSVPRPVSILSVIRSKLLVVRFLGDYTGILEHWDRRPPSVPCRGDDCPGKYHSMRTVWKGFAPVETWDEKERLWIAGVLEITESLEHLLSRERLRGLVWSLFFEETERHHKKVQGFTVPCVETQPIRDAFDVRPIVCHAYHDQGIRFDVPNPLPPRVCMEAVAGDAPSLPQAPDQLRQAPDTPEEVERKKQMFARMKATRKTYQAGDQSAKEGNGKGATHERS